MNIASNLGVRAQHEFLNTNDNSQDTINNAICKYENHPGIISIEKRMEGTNSSLAFETVIKEKIGKVATKLNSRKAV